MIDNNSRFSYNPSTNATRSRFDMSTSVKTSFDAAQLVPFYYEEVLPGDTFDLETNFICRMQTLLTPIMDDLYLDTFYFYVPNRIVWEHWKDFMGENTKSAWYPKTEYTIPQINVAPSKTVVAKSVADYFGVPPLTVPSGSGNGFSFSALPFRAYAMIWNEWFRDENLQDPVLVDYGDSTHAYDSASAVDGGKPLFANKYHDYFTSALPSPQKGADVTIPMLGAELPVMPTSGSIRSDGVMPDRGVVMKRYSAGGSYLGDIDANRYMIVGMNDTDPALGNLFQGATTVTDARGTQYVPDNLYAIANNVPVASINTLRLAFATQALLEKDARGGTRYREIIKNHFNTLSPDARQQVPELLSYNRTRVDVSQVVQNSATQADSPQGTTTAFSLTANSDGSFVKSFTEHGMVIGLMCVRYNHTYQQGLDRRFSRLSRFDYYWPVFANLGEQPIKNKEIYLSGTSTDSEVFGYQEAWAEYRYHPDICTSEMRSSYPQSLDVWHLGDKYASLPSLSDTWIKEDKDIVNRVLAVSDNVSNQFFADIFVKNYATRVMPMYSIPGMPRTL